MLAHLVIFIPTRSLSQLRDTEQVRQSLRRETQIQSGHYRNDADRPIEGESLRPKVSFPNYRAVDGDTHLAPIQVREQRMGIARFQDGNRCRTSRFDVLVTAISALGTGVHAGITLNGDNQPVLRFNTPHCVHEIATILGSHPPKIAESRARNIKGRPFRVVCSDLHNTELLRKGAPS
jgi:hypothetical protein